MGQLIIAANYGAKVTSDEVTATRNDIVKGKTTIMSDSDDEIIDGTLELTGTATESDVVEGETYYSTNPHDKKNGGLKDNSGTVLSATPTLDTANGRVQLTVPATAKYNTLSKLYSTYAALRSVIGLTASKLANGQSLLGLTGTYKGLGNAVDTDVRRGKTFSTASLSNAIGNMLEMGAQTVTPGNSQKIVSCSGKYLTGNITVKGDTNLAAQNIKLGKSIFGVQGNSKEHKYKYGNVVSSTNKPHDGLYSVTINLGFTPIAGYILYYGNENRDITIYSPNNGVGKQDEVVNFNQAKRWGLNSCSFGNGDNGVQIGHTVVLPVSYGGVTYGYWFAGY